MSTPLAVPATPARPRRLLRSVGAVLGALAANAVLSLAIDQVLHVLGVYPPWGQPMDDSRFLLATAYRLVIGVASGYLAARLAPDRPMRHAIALGVVGVVLSLAGALATWNRPELGPKWYPLSLIVLAIPCAWLGGVIHRARRS